MATPAPPFRRYVRRLLKLFGSAGVSVLSRTEVSGRDLLPRRGPFLVAGNHRAIMEVFLMLFVTRSPVDIIGAGDFPLDLRYRFLARLYGYVPYRRGSVDGAALRRARSILESGGVVGIFPEGGIWTGGPKETHRGVAWLAANTGFPVIPIGFGGIDAGLERLLGLGHPRFAVNVGRPIRFDGDPQSRADLDRFARSVMSEVEALVPAWDRATRPLPEWEQYSFALSWHGKDGRTERELFTDGRAQALSRFFHLRVLLSIFSVNLKRDVRALERAPRPVPPGEVVAALRRISCYVRRRNRFLFTYRLGVEQGTLLLEAVEWLAGHVAAGSAARKGARVALEPIRLVKWPGREAQELQRPLP